MNFSAVQGAFVGGEISPSLWARVDQTFYQTACRQMLNFFFLPQGGASNRAGFKLICPAKYDNQPFILEAFKFSYIQAYTLEIGGGYMRFIKDGGQIVTSGVAAYNAGTSYNEGQMATSGGLTYYSRVDGNIGNTPASSPTQWHAMVNSSTPPAAIYEIPNPYSSADLPVLKFEQNKDKMWITHPLYKTRILTRSGHTAWTLKQEVYGSPINAPSSVTVTGSTTGNNFGVTSVNSDGDESDLSALTPTAAVGATLNWSAVTGASFYNVYENLYGFYQFKKQVAGLSYVIENLTPDASKGPPSHQLLFETTDNYPGLFVFHQQRGVYMRTNNKPETWFASETGVFNSFPKSSPILADEAIEYTLNANEIQEIRQAVSIGQLLAFTGSGLWKINGATNDILKANEKPLAVRQSSIGSNDLKPIVANNSVLYVDASSRAVYEVLYDFNTNYFKPNNISILAAHMFERKKIIDWCYQQNPDSIIWNVREDGVLAGLTYLKEQQVVGWHRHTTKGKFLTVAGTQASDGLTDLLAGTQRTINGTQRQFIEQLDRRDFDYPEECFFVDCGLTRDEPITVTNINNATGVVTAPAHGLADGDVIKFYQATKADEEGDPKYHEINSGRFIVDNATTDTFTLIDEDTETTTDTTEFADYLSFGVVRECTATISGLSHLNGEKVTILADGEVIDPILVSGGSITLPYKAGLVHAGLAIPTARLTPMAPEQQLPTGTLQDKTRQINSCFIRWDRTLTLRVGPNSRKMEDIAFRSEERWGEPVGLQTGFRSIPLQNSDDRNGILTVEIVDPLPCTVQAMIYRISTSGRPASASG